MELSGRISSYPFCQTGVASGHERYLVVTLWLLIKQLYCSKIVLHANKVTEKVTVLPTNTKVWYCLHKHLKIS